MNIKTLINLTVVLVASIISLNAKASSVAPVLNEQVLKSSLSIHQAQTFQYDEGLIYHSYVYVNLENSSITLRVAGQTQCPKGMLCTAALKPVVDLTFPIVDIRANGCLVQYTALKDESPLGGRLDQIIVNSRDLSKCNANVNTEVFYSTSIVNRRNTKALYRTDVFSGSALLPVSFSPRPYPGKPSPVHPLPVIR